MSRTDRSSSSAHSGRCWSYRTSRPGDIRTGQFGCTLAIPSQALPVVVPPQAQRGTAFLPASEPTGTPAPTEIARTMKTLSRRPAVDPRGWSLRPRPLIGRRGIAGLLVVVLAGGLFVSVPPAKVSADALSDAYNQQQQLEKQIAAQRARLAALNANQRTLSAKLSATKATLGSVVSDLTSVKVDIVSMVVDVAQAQQGVDELTATVAQLDRELADLQMQERVKQDQLTARKAMLAERIRTAYDTDRTSLLETILSSNDFTDVLSQVDDHLAFADQDKALAMQISEDQQVLAVIHQSTALARGQADAMAAAAAAGKAALDQQLADLAA